MTSFKDKDNHQVQKQMCAFRLGCSSVDRELDQHPQSPGADLQQ